MAWPTSIEHVMQLPHDERAGLSLRLMTPDLESTIVEFALNNDYVLERITEGDPRKEKMLGGVLIQLASMAANNRKDALKAQATLDA